MSISEYNMTIPKNIEALIKERGLKRNAVAKWAGFSNQQFTDMLNGRKIIKVCDAMAIADALGISISDLFGDTDRPANQKSNT